MMLQNGRRWARHGYPNEALAIRKDFAKAAVREGRITYVLYLRVDPLAKEEPDLTAADDDEDGPESVVLPSR